jgi:hypothetical protein
VIYDADDWLGGMPPFWPAYDHYFVRGTTEPTALLHFHERLLRQADMVTCTVQPLADKLAVFNERVRVVPNCVLWGDWDTVLPLQKQTDGPVIGWFGLPYYWETWREIADAVDLAVRETYAHLVILGYPEIVQIFSPYLREHTLVQPMVPWRQFAEMRRMISTFDVGLCWLRDTPFNRCKSPLRALQYGAAGVPIVASEVVYGEALSESYPGEFGAVTKTPLALAHALTNALQHPAPVGVKASAWREQVWKCHSYETQWRAWERIILEVLDG